MKSGLTKIFTLIMFVILITSFVMYKSGYLDGQKLPYLANSSYSTSNSPTDTIPQKKTKEKIEMMPSSKVIILKEHSIQRSDSIQPKVNSSIDERSLIYSSKSGLIVLPKDLKNLEIDSTTNDSLKH